MDRSENEEQTKNSLTIFFWKKYFSKNLKDGSYEGSGFATLCYSRRHFVKIPYALLIFLHTHAHTETE